MSRGYVRWITVIVAAVIVCLGLALATYSVAPGESALLLRGGKAVTVGSRPGLHWKLPLVDSIARLDTRTRLSTGRVRLSSSASSGLAARYIVLWRVSDPQRFYAATSSDAMAVQEGLNAALTPPLREAMSAGDAKDFLAGSTAALVSRMEAAIKPVAQKLGINVLRASLATADIPAKLATRIAATMAAGTATRIAAVKAQGKGEREEIAAQAAAKRVAVISDARNKAATITGKSETRVAALYAPIAKQAPRFFRYFLALESEAAALKSHTRLLVISMDSPWFKELEKSSTKAREPQ